VSILQVVKQVKNFVYLFTMILFLSVYIDIKVKKANKELQRKGTVSQDFLHLVFCITKPRPSVPEMFRDVQDFKHFCFR
jgi:hypothetical protein